MSTAAVSAAVARVPLTVVMPAYNEAARIEHAVGEVQREILDRVPGAELIVVNDGSKDETGSVLDREARRDARIRVIHQPNGGHGSALMTALELANGEFVFLVDSDQQIPLDRFPEAWSLVTNGKDGVFGIRRHRNDPAVRVHLTRLVRFAVAVMFRVSLFDANVPYKLIKRSIWEEARAVIPPGTLAPSLFLALYAKRRGFDIAEVDVFHRQRQAGQASIRRWKLLKFCMRGFRQMLVFRRAVLHGR
jgi:glycosyltransferase involved in cell wall biosynthesis